MKVIRTLLLFIAIGVLVSACGSSKEVVDETTMTDVELFQYGNEFLQTGHYEEALAAYQYLLDKFPISDLHIETQMRMAEAYLKLDNFEEQTDILLRLLRENIIPEKVPEIYCQIGRYYERAGEFNPGITTSDTVDYKEAISYYNKALEYEDSDEPLGKSQALYRRGLAEAKIGEIDKAIADYEAVTARFPDQPYSLLAQVKLQDPYNLTELALDDNSVRSYKQLLGIMITDEEEAEKPEEEEVVEEVPQDQIDAVIQQAEEEQKLIEDEQLPVQQEEIEQIPQEQSDEIIPQDETNQQDLEQPVEEETSTEETTPEQDTEQVPLEDQSTEDSFIDSPADTTSN